MDSKEIDLLLVECKCSISKITEIWKDIGISDDRLKSRYEKLKKEILDNLDDLYNEELERKDCLLKSIFETEEYIKMTCKQLDIEYVIGEYHSLIMKDNLLLQKKDDLDAIKNDRLYRLKSFLDQEEKLCEKLFQCKKMFIINEIPTEDQLDEIYMHVNLLKKTKEARLKDLLIYQQKIKKLEEILGRNFRSDAFLCNLLYGESLDIIPLSEETLKDCLAIIQNLENDVDVNKSKIFNLRKQYHDLLTSLSDSCQLVPKPYASYDCEIWTDEIINKLDGDVKNLRRMRHEKLGEIIKSTKENLIELMKECLAGHKVYNETYKSLLETDEISENVLTSLEGKIRMWNNAKNEIIVIKLDLDHLFSAQQESKDIAEALKNPEIRKNRGGILLKTQKEQKENINIINNCKKALRTHITCFNNSDVCLDDLKYNNMDLLDIISEITEEKENKIGHAVRSVYASTSNLSANQARSVYASSSNLSLKQATSVNSSNSNLNSKQKTVPLGTKNTYQHTSSKVPKFKRNINPGENASSERF